MNEESSNNATTAANQGSRRDEPPPPSAPTTRPTRSKTGCLTCRRRKVRCDEQRPRCSHCERLNLECRWRPTPSFGPQRKMETNGVAPSPAAGPNGVVYGSSPDNVTDSPGSNHWPQNPGAVDQLFDFASFMWDAGGATLGQASPGGGNDCFNTGLDSLNAWSLPNGTYNNGSHTNPPLVATPTSRPQHAGDTSWTLPARPPSSVPPAHTAEDRHLIEYFVRTAPPPILADVETQKAWSSVRQILVSMSNVSTMVRCAILAFSNLLLCRRDAPWMQCPPRHYENATAQLMAIGDLATVVSHSPLREHLLVTIFFLSYVDIVEDRVEGAHANLKRAFEIFQQGDKRGFRPLELRLLSWIRHLDARVVSAGGEGLFLSDNCEAILVHPSPGSVVADVENDGSPPDEVRELDIEDVLFQVLYHPGIVFFQKVQSFMGRISRIDRWHRSRGTVEDETEVINIALQILKDLRKVYDDRPALMDHAVSGHLAAPHVSAELAFSITRAFRTYLSNYHASKVHLHRVAYTNLPLTRETEDALSQIRHLTRLMVGELGPEDSLPVSQLWPLLMLGAEEKDPEERGWIKAQIRRMKNVATNALITGQVLEEVQARQDAGGGRADIRGVMHDIFDSCFAIM
ncbi:uncharacterized protein DNG_07840 [Cephalotrichum gorgonifer]|uniref:Zn(2)-C6 fungal-type domain-containing protein n=1 Tax=Cephalotrichum gorgonifer TaxID=2041049 RepID=A0AAE8N463_9PEZI|nr:uncharacterized protein DNG_07840 [Cephalotrichum gorgonifer]